VIRVADLQDQPIVSYDQPSLVRWGMDEVFASGQLLSQVVAIAPYSVNIATMVKEGLGIGLLHPVSAYDFLDSNLILRRFEHPMPFYTLKITPQGAAPAPHLDELSRVMEESLDEVMAAVNARLGSTG
jgi:DNA-binding transcriptional LysR family regulator